MNKIILYTIVFIFILSIVACDNRKINFNEGDKLLAFPTAEGGGANSIGGRGGRVIEVSNLNDSGKGSLREACEANGSRTVIFRVGGTIDLKGKNIFIKNDNITIAGQTALGDGIQIKNGGLIINASEVIVRYLRIRLGSEYMGVNDALDIASPNRHNRKKNIIIDHVSAFWGVDETMNGGSFSDNVTLQWSIIAEGLHCSVYNNGGLGESWKICKELNGKPIWAHSRGSKISEESHNISFHHNLLYRNYKRNPLIQSSDVDVVNNVIVNYQYQVYIETFKGEVHANFIGKYFRSYIHKRPPIRVFNTNKKYNRNSGIYYRDNYDKVFRKDENQTQTDIRVMSNISKNISDNIKDMNSSYYFPPIQTQPVHQAYNIVLEYVGANFPTRDSVDNRIISFVKSGKAPKSFVNTPDEVGGYPILKGAKAPIDSDHDGMPDIWENSYGLNSYNPTDRNGKELSHVGYTNLEIYLNSIVNNYVYKQFQFNEKNKKNKK